MLLPKQNAVSQIQSNHSGVCALPGSGKTYVNTELCLNLLNNNPSNSILNITFTRTAAAEMKKRLSQKLTQDQMRQVKVSTIDSAMVAMANAYFKHTQSRYKLLIGGSYYFVVLRIVNEINEFTVEEVMEILDYYLSFPKLIQFENEKHQAVFDLYRKIISNTHPQSFDLKTLAKLLISKMEAGEIRPYAYDHIIIDEYQDTGQLQYQWLKHHGSLGNSILIGIGDDDQSLYRFAGSLGYDNFLNLKNDFNADEYTLDTCFRCAPKILKYAESIITKNNHRVPKEFNAFDASKPGVINIYEHDGIVESVTTKLAHGAKNTAILCRTNQQANDIEVALGNEGIAYQRLNAKGGLLSDYNVLAYAKLLISVILDKDVTNLIDVFAWQGESEKNLVFLERYFSQRKIIKPSQLDISELNKQGLSTSTNTILNNMQTWRRYADDENVFKTQKAIITAIEYRMTKFASKRVRSFSDFITKRLSGSTFKKRVEALDKIHQQIKNDTAEINREVITIATMHASKGLEWDSVWIVDVSHENIPLTEKESIIQAKNDAVAHLEDERRLYYVAVTRAERELNLTFEKEVSQFISDSDLSLVNFYDVNGAKVPIP